MPKFGGPRNTFTRFTRPVTTTASRRSTASRLVRRPALRRATRTATRSRTASRTMTMTKNKRNPMARKIVRGNVGGVPSFSSYSASRPINAKVSAMKHVGASNYYVTNQARQLVVAEGYQNAISFPHQSWSDIQSISALAVPSGQPSTYTSASVYTKQFVLESLKSEFLMTNSTLATCYVDIYDVVRKRDAQTGAGRVVPSPSAPSSGQDLIPNATQKPEDSWLLGSSIEAGYPVTVQNPQPSQMVGALPTDSLLFKDYFKVVQRSHIALSQGATHRHTINLKSNHLVDQFLLSGDYQNDIAGLTMYTMIVCYGQPASISGGDSAPVVTTAKVALDIVVGYRYKYTWISDSTVSFTSSDNLSSLTGEQVVSIGAGQIVANATV